MTNQYGIGSLLFALCLAAAGASAEDPAKTTLRVVGAPQGTFENSILGLQVTYVQAEIKNVGSAPAEDVRVSAILPGGQHKQLWGPRTLAPNESATYTAKPYEAVTSSKKIQAQATCSNCRR